MQTQRESELVSRLVEAVTPWLDDCEYSVLCMARGAEPNRRMITALLAVAAQKQCVLPTGLAKDLWNWRRRHRTVNRCARSAAAPARTDKRLVTQQEHQPASVARIHTVT